MLLLDLRQRMRNSSQSSSDGPVRQLIAFCTELNILRQGVVLIGLFAWHCFEPDCERYAAGFKQVVFL